MVSKTTGRRKERVLKVRLLSSGEVVSEETGEAVTFERLKTERVRLHLGPGLVEPTDRRQEVSGLRNLFLERVRELELSRPKEGRERLRPVLWALAGTPFLEFTRAQVTEDDLFLLLEDVCCEGVDPLPEKLGEVREAVLEWGRGTNLTAGWCLEQAVDTLWLWRESPASRNELRWENGTQLVMTVISDLPPPESIVPVYDFPAWSPDAKPLKSYEESVRPLAARFVEEAYRSGGHPLLSLAKPKTLESLVNDVVAAVVGAAKSQSLNAYLGAHDESGDRLWRPVKGRRALAKRIDWAIYCTVGGLGVMEVATQEDADLGEVSKGVSEVLDLIGLPKPKDLKRGRRKGSKDSLLSDRRK